MTSLAAWLEVHVASAPPALATRVREYALGPEPEHAGVPHRLADAGARALAGVTGRPGDRSVALDLLAADALITLALVAQAEQDPAGLRALAADLLRRHGSAA